MVHAINHTQPTTVTISTQLHSTLPNSPLLLLTIQLVLIQLSRYDQYRSLAQADTVQWRVSATTDSVARKPCRVQIFCKRM